MEGRRAANALTRPSPLVSPDGMEEDDDAPTIRARRIVVTVTAIDETYVSLDQGAKIELQQVPDNVRSLLQINARFVAQMHGTSVYHLRPIGSGTSLHVARTRANTVRQDPIASWLLCSHRTFGRLSLASDRSP